MPTPTLFHPRLSRIEHRLLVLAAAGWQRPELALLSDLDGADVDRRLAGIEDKLGAGSLEEAIERAAQLGLVKPAAVAALA